MTIQATALKVADSVAQAAGMLRPLAFEDLVRRARRHTGLNDFGDVAFAAPLQRFLESCASEASLSLFGHLATRWDVVRFLSNLLRLRAAEVRTPAILTEHIERPIIITGLPRSGTTFLHRMMLADPVNRAPLVYETIYPYPLGRRDTRAAVVGRQLRMFKYLAPEFRALHPLDATSPQECCEITAHVFRSLRFDTNYHIPSYRRWLDADPRGHVPAFEFHKRFLQHLQHQDRARPPARTPRWVLKCPDHLFSLGAIRAVYPDARLVFVHRDPVKVLLSVARLTEVLRQPFTRRLDPMEIGRQESLRWLEGTRRMMQVGDDAGLVDPVCHVHYLDLVSDPVATVEQVYRHFELPVPRTMVETMESRVAAEPTGGYGVHAYRFEDHGLDAEAERQKFRPYMLHFGVERESAPARRGGHSVVVPASAFGT